MHQAANSGEIFIIDDDPANLRFLQKLLERKGYAVRSFLEGAAALDAAREHLPDLILTDVDMPEMNGFELCRQLKASAATREIPVIFVSALGEAMDIVTAFQAGGADYVTKPFQFEEVRARIETHLKLRRNQLTLLRYNEHLEELVRQRSEELAEAHRRLAILDRAKSDFLKLISHELRTPLNGLLGVGQIILDECQAATSGVDELRELFDNARDTLLNIIDDALLLTQIEVSADSFQLAPLEIVPVLNAAVDLTADFAGARGVSLRISAGGAGQVLADRDLLGKALSAILKTAVKLCDPGKSVSIGCDSDGDEVTFTVEVMGRQLPDDALANFFEVFSVGKRITHDCDLGLAPPVAERIVSMLGGSLTIRNQTPDGVCFALRIRRGLHEADGSDDRQA